MAHWRKVDTRFLGDAKYRSLSDEAQHLFLTLLLHPNLTTVGAMRSGAGHLSEDMGWPQEKTRRALDELSDVGLVTVDHEARCLVLPGWIKYNPPNSNLNVRQWEHALDHIPECALRAELVEVLRAHCEERGPTFARAFESVTKSLGKSLAEGHDMTHAKQRKRERWEPSANAPGSQDPSANASGSFASAEPPPCPHAEIVELYHEILPELPHVRSWGKERQKYLRARWREDSERQTLDWWREYFATVRRSAFLMGQRNGSSGTSFRCSLEWLVRPLNFAKVLDECYVDPDDKQRKDSEQEILSTPDPHDHTIHGMIDVTGKRRWCSREGGWIPEDDWTPLQEGDALD